MLCCYYEINEINQWHADVNRLKVHYFSIKAKVQVPPPQFDNNHFYELKFIVLQLML